MAYDFLSLVNDVNAEVNEVPLDETNFETVQGYHVHSKRAVNAALRSINQSSFEWPFNHVTLREELNEGQGRYFFPTEAKSINFDSFRVFDGERAYRVMRGDYEEYLDRHIDADFNGERYIGNPKTVYQTPDFQFILFPTPRVGLEAVYEYYRLPLDLVAATDAPYIPEQFRHVIVSGALGHVYKFRGDIESANFQREEFKQGIKEMRAVYQNRFEFVRSSYIPQGTRSGVRVSR